MVTKCDVFSLKVQKAGTLKAIVKSQGTPSHQTTKAQCTTCTGDVVWSLNEAIRPSVAQEMNKTLYIHLSVYKLQSGYSWIPMRIINPNGNV